jgi:hypothetical protein
MGQALMATPAISDGMIIMRAQGYVYAVAERAQAKPAPPVRKRAG